ncbi:hypothetical protein OBBRIDRAFT_808570 [Obba rivulosa]|uniref:Alcohol dehydrogenase-like N-terminal domain-containing protein n=1 Tax=Obba rivulosa TaxID=1052685 RepID=A0A8E2DFN7_9APHY|nr:hypothetical protein OBBRIDRAFT_808570 [Obba rivulosa]
MHGVKSAMPSLSFCQPSLAFVIVPSCDPGHIVLHDNKAIPRDPKINLREYSAMVNFLPPTPIPPFYAQMAEQGVLARTHAREQHYLVPPQLITGRGDTTQQGKRVQVKEYPVPPVGDGDILVNTVAVAQNLTDWEFVDTVQNAGEILGCEWSGHIVASGKDIPSLKIGGHVAGFLQINLWTAAQALDHPTRLGLLEPAERVMRPEGGKVVLVLKLVPEAKVQGDIEIKYTLIYTSLGRAFDLRESHYGPISSKDRAYMAVFLRKVPALVKDDNIMLNWIRLGTRRFGTGCSICTRDKCPFVKGARRGSRYREPVQQPILDGRQLEDRQLLSEYDVVPRCVVDLKGPWPLYDAGKGTASAISGLAAGRTVSQKSVRDTLPPTAYDPDRSTRLHVVVVNAPHSLVIMGLLAPARSDLAKLATRSTSTINARVSNSAKSPRILECMMRAL